MTLLNQSREMTNILLLEGIHKDAVETFEEERFSVEYLKKSLAGDALKEKIRNVHVVGVRSKTHISKEILHEAKKLMAIGSFCIGTNNIDKKEATKQAIALFNEPYSNTRSVSELVICLIIDLFRGVTRHSMKLHNKVWEKTAKESFEIRGKTLGIVGYGHIGSQVSVLAEVLGMNIIYYDSKDKLPLGNARPMTSLKELLKSADIVTLHVPENKSTRGMIGNKELVSMKQGSYLINTSRGSVVEIPHLAEALRTKHIAGAAIDVYPEEPHTEEAVFETELQEFDNVILTPHIAGSTLEAQRMIARNLSKKLVKFITQGSTGRSINFPSVELPVMSNKHRIIHIHKNIPGVLSKLNTVYSQHKINIEGQYLKTNDVLGYVVTDINQKLDSRMTDELSSVPGTIRVRILY
jgi:D-3-phosphoglycerate dehydrogenase